MTNYFVSYDLNGPKPTHAEMDKHLKKLGPCVLRVLETVWFVPSSKTTSELYDYIATILFTEDRLLVISAARSQWDKLLVSDQTLKDCWQV